MLNGGAPFKKDKSGHVYDRSGERVRLIGDSLKILQQLASDPMFENTQVVSARPRRQHAHDTARRTHDSRRPARPAPGGARDSGCPAKGAHSRTLLPGLLQAYVSRTEYPEWAIPCLKMFDVVDGVTAFDLAPIQVGWGRGGPALHSGFGDLQPYSSSRCAAQRITRRQLARNCHSWGWASVRGCRV